jgi:hypothetical protein
VSTCTDTNGTAVSGRLPGIAGSTPLWIVASIARSTSGASGVAVVRKHAASRSRNAFSVASLVALGLPFAHVTLYGEPTTSSTWHTTSAVAIAERGAGPSSLVCGRCAKPSEVKPTSPLCSIAPYATRSTFVKCASVGCAICIVAAGGGTGSLARAWTMGCCAAPPHADKMRTRDHRVIRV